MAKYVHVDIQVYLQVFSKLASDWLAAVSPANQKPGLKILNNGGGAMILQGTYYQKRKSTPRYLISILIFLSIQQISSHIWKLFDLVLNSSSTAKNVKLLYGSIGGMQ